MSYSLEDILTTKYIELLPQYKVEGEHFACPKKGIQQLLISYSPNNPIANLETFPWRLRQQEEGTKFFHLTNCYWLPWMQDYTEFEKRYPGETCGCNTALVTWQVLEKAKAKFFLTSEFSGCRLAVDEKGIQHVSCEENDGSRNRDNTTIHGGLKMQKESAQADPAALLSKVESGGLRSSYKARTMSIGEAPTILDRDCIYAHTFLEQRTLVIGQKIGNTWNFYAQHRDICEKNYTFKKMWSVCIFYNSNLKHYEAKINSSLSLRLIDIIRSNGIRLSSMFGKK